MEILQLTANGSTLVSSELETLLDDVHPDVVCLQEPYSTNNKVIGINHRHKTITATRHPKAAIVITNENITVTQVTNLCTEHLITAEVINGDDKWIIASLYAQYSHDIQPYAQLLKDVLHSAGNRKAMILADINARSTLWHSNKTDDRGRIINDVLDGLDSYIIDTPNQQPTYSGHHGYTSNIDITIVTAKALPYVKRWTVLEHATHSDHNAILTETTTQTTTPHQDTKQRLLLHKADWTTMKDFIETYPLETIDGSIDCKTHVLTDILQKAQRTAIPATNVRQKGKVIWSTELTRLGKDSRTKRKWYQHSKTAEEREYRRQQYRDAKDRYHKELQTARMDEWNSDTKDKLQTNIWGDHNETRRRIINKGMEKFGRISAKRPPS